MESNDQPQRFPLLTLIHKKQQQQLQFRITKRKNNERKVLTDSTMRREVYISNNRGFRKEIEKEN